MNFIESKGIVLRTLKYSESSLICDIYTEKVGLRSFIISNSKNARNKTNLLQAMNLINLVFYDNTDSKLNRIKEVFLTFPYKTIGIDVIRSCVGTMMLEVTRNVVKEHEANEELYQFIISWFQRLDQTQEKLKYFHLKYMIDLTDHIGFSPLNNFADSNPYFDLLAGEFVGERYQNQTSLDQRASYLLHQLLKFDLDGLNESNDINVKERDTMVEDVIRYYELHVPSFRKIKSLDVLKQILS